MKVPAYLSQTVPAPSYDSDIFVIFVNDLTDDIECQCSLRAARQRSHKKGLPLNLPTWPLGYHGILVVLHTTTPARSSFSSKGSSLAYPPLPPTHAPTASRTRTGICSPWSAFNDLQCNWNSGITGVLRDSPSLPPTTDWFLTLHRDQGSLATRKGCSPTRSVGVCLPPMLSPLEQQAPALSVAPFGRKLLPRSCLDTPTSSHLNHLMAYGPRG